jgi:hypothetical protein
MTSMGVGLLGKARVQFQNLVESRFELSMLVLQPLVHLDEVAMPRFQPDVAGAWSIGLRLVLVLRLAVPIGTEVIVGFKLPRETSPPAT